MPKQLLHRGTPFSLIPMALPADEEAKRPKAYPDGKCSPECHGGHPILGQEGYSSYVYSRGHLGPDRAEGTIEDYEPNAQLSWSKGREGDNSGDPGDEGYVFVDFEMTEDWLRRQMFYFDQWGDEVPKPERITFQSGPLSWRDLNVMAKAARTARDDAFDSPA